MALPQNYKWRKGDRVTLAGTVAFDRVDDDVHVNIGAAVYDDTVVIDPHDVGVELAATQFIVGDYVRDKTDGVNGEVVAVFDQWAWVKLNNNKPVGIRIADLELLQRPIREVAQCSA